MPCRACLGHCSERTPPGSLADRASSASSIVKQVSLSARSDTEADHCFAAVAPTKITARWVCFRPMSTSAPWLPQTTVALGKDLHEHLHIRPPSLADSGPIRPNNGFLFRSDGGKLPILFARVSKYVRSCYLNIWIQP